MLCSDTLLKSRSHCHDFNADFPRQIVDVLVAVNREHLLTICSFYSLSTVKLRILNRSGNILSFLLPLFQEGQLSVTGESMCTKYWLTA